MKKCALLAVGLFVAVYILPLGVRPLVIPDETRYAEVPREMVASGDWVTPRLDGFRYFEKPILGYWLNAASILLLGQNNFAVRLPAALSTGLSALFIFLIVRRFAGGTTNAAIAAMMFLTCFLVFGVGTFNVLDSLLSMLLTGAMASFFFASQADASKTRRLAYLALFGAFCGLAFLAKGFLAMLVPVMIIFPWLLWHRRFVEFLCVSLIPLAFAILIALPWAVAVHLRQPDFWHYFFWVEHVQRFTTPAPGQHPEGWWYLIPVILGGVLPWTALLGCIFTGLRATGIKDPLIRFCLCWLVIPFVFFSLSSGKLATYILPCFPPLIILAIIGMARYFTIDTKAFCNSTRTFIVIVVILAIALVALQIFPLPASVRIGMHIAATNFYSPDEALKLPLLTACLVVYALFLYLSIRATTWHNRLLLCCIAPVLLFAAGPYMLPQHVFDGKAPDPFLAKYAAGLGANTTIVTDRYNVSAVCWYLDRSDVYLLGGPGELSYGTSYADSKHRLLTPEQLCTLITDNQSGSSTVLITSDNRWPNSAEGLPKPAIVISGHGFVLARFISSRNETLPLP
jgi:4-amino-4-deoxy-L-arabinose transferase